MPHQPRIAILVPSHDHPEAWQPGFARKALALRAAGLAVEQRLWTDPGDLSGFDLVTALFAWGYQRDVPRWYALLDRLETERLPVVNPAMLLRWNSDKAYLTDLAAAGVPVVPTQFVDALDVASFAAACTALGAVEVVIKPAISAGADATYRLQAGDALPADAVGQRRLVQPLMPGIVREGEFSLFLFDGILSHAIVKRPAVGDFRVQDQFGGEEFACEATPAARALADAALAACPVVPSYARVDMVGDAAGNLHIMELELIEPSLFLHFAPDKGAAFAVAISRAATTAPSTTIAG
jgi:glutathione synthase/RimK-type ligase-like ATP-grasp enzyme